MIKLFTSHSHYKTLKKFSSSFVTTLMLLQVITPGGMFLATPAIAATDQIHEITAVTPTTGTLHVVKHVVGGSSVAGDFNLTVTGGSPSLPSFPGSETGTDVTVNLGHVYTVSETASSTYTMSASADCSGTLDVDHLTKTCTITNTFNGNVVGHGDPFKVKIVKYVDGVQATASSSNSYAFPFASSWTSPTPGSGTYTIDANGFGGSPAYQAWTSDMTGPANYSTHEITSNIDPASNVLPVNAECVPGKFKLVGYKTGSTLANAESAELSTSAPSLTGISSEQYIIVYNHKCADPVHSSTATINASKIVCASESDLPNWSGSSVNITSTTAADYVAAHPNCHLEPNWQFQWAPSGTPDPGGSFVGEAGSPWTTFGMTNVHGMTSTTIQIPRDNFVWVREVLKDGYIPFSGGPGNLPGSNVSAEMYCNTDVLNYDNYDFVDNIQAGHSYNCVAFNAPHATPSVPTATLTATKVVCANESDLPNWSGNPMTINSTTATDYVAAHPNCHLEPNWQFQARFWQAEDSHNLTITPNATDPGGAFVGVAGTPWTTLPGTTNASGTISTTFNANNVWHVFVREVLKDGYIPFSGGPGNLPGSNVSAEMYCNTDVLNYDNLEIINGPFHNGDHFYCVAFNAPVSTTTPPAHLMVIKNVVGGTATSGEFMINVTGAGATPTSFRGNASGTDVSLNPSTNYSVTEVTHSSYTATYSAGCNGTSINQYHPVTCIITNTFNGSSTPSTFKVHILKYLDGVQATASSSNSYAFPFSATFTSPSVGSGNYTIGPAGWGGSPAYQAWTSEMTGPANYATHEITSDMASSSSVLPIGAQCIPGRTQLVGYRTGSSLIGAEVAALSTSSPSFTGINSDQYVIAYNRTCPPAVSGTGHLVVNKVVINDNGGTGTTTDFSFLVNGTSSTHFNAGGQNVLTLDAGTYNITEGTSTGYTASYNGCSGISLVANGTSTCTITNNDIAPLQCPVTNGFVESDTSTMVGNNNAVLLSFVHPAWTADVDGASTSARWIWSTNPVATTTATTTAIFTRTFTVNGSSTSATLRIAADNLYRVSINGNPVGTSTNGTNFAAGTEGNFNVSSFLVNGTNTLTIEVTNLPTPGVTDPNSNPAGLLYSLSWSANNCPIIAVGGQGGDNAGVSTTSGGGGTNNHTTSTTGNTGTVNTTPNPLGQVLGISTTNPNTPLGQVLGISSTLPGLPNTGGSPITQNETSSRSGFEVIIMGILALCGLYVMQFRLFKRR